MVLVTGASGFVGQYLVPHLAARGWSVRAAARNPASIPSGARISALSLPDLSEAADWRPLVSGCSHVVHLAGLAHATSAIPESTYMSINAEAARTLAVAARESGVRRIVLLSSVKAQSDAVSDHELSEQDEPHPVDAYGRSKLVAERFIAEALDGSATDWTVLRPVLVYGPGVKGNMRTLYKLAQMRWPLPLGSLRARRSILSLGNLASAIEHALISPATSRKIFLVADPEPVTVPEMLVALRAGLGRAPGLLRVPLQPAAFAARVLGKSAAWARVAGNLVVDTSALSATGWQPVESSVQALQKVFAQEK